ncbi:hypothetical protein ABIA32_000468 [Streptacidiphilus sp. MAP12-20]|uniref:hypothetical protein n=1 Tax=Streptacidiphilus sp. MAP12-20 TaxID=3156299 RepID=UPI0035120C69
MDRTGTGISTTLRAFATAAAAVVGFAVLAGCSSGTSTPGPTTTAATATATGTDTGSATATGSTGGGSTTGGGDDGGGFNTAGRISDNFSGTWPDDVHLTVENHSATDAFVGTVRVADCTSETRTQQATPPSQPVNVPPNGAQPLDFNFNPDTESPAISPHTVCVTLYDQQGNQIDKRTTTVVDPNAPTSSESASPSPTP